MARLDESEVKSKLEELDGWELEGNAITRDFDKSDFAGSVEFVNRIAEVAEQMNHHPDLEISWSTVSVKITTHSEGGLTDADFELAKRIDELG